MTYQKDPKIARFAECDGFVEQASKWLKTRRPFSLVLLLMISTVTRDCFKFPVRWWRTGRVVPRVGFLPAPEQARNPNLSPTLPGPLPAFRHRYVFVLALLAALSWHPPTMGAQQLGAEAPSPARTALVVWNLGSDLLALVEREAEGISEIERNVQFMALRLRVAEVGLELSTLPELSSTSEQNTSTLLAHVYGQVADLYAAITQAHGSRTAAVFITSFYTRLMVLFQAIDDPWTRRLLLLTKQYIQTAGFPDDLWVGPLDRVEASFGSAQAKIELFDLRNNLFNHLVDLERFEQSGHFAEAAPFLWQAALDWWEWASRYAAGEPAASIERYKIAAESVGKRYRLTLLRVARISNPDPEKDRLGALSYLITSRSFVGKQIEEKLGLQTRYLFEFALEAQYLRSELTAFDLQVLIDLAKRSGVPESYWSSVVELSSTAERGGPKLISAVLKMNRDIADYLATFGGRSP